MTETGCVWIIFCGELSDCCEPLGCYLSKSRAIAIINYEMERILATCKERGHEFEWRLDGRQQSDTFGNGTVVYESTLSARKLNSRFLGQWYINEKRLLVQLKIDDSPIEALASAAD